MTAPGAGRPLIHLVGAARAGDPVTSVAAHLSRRTAGSGRPGRLLSAAPTSVAAFEHTGLDELPDGDVVVHSVDGGRDLLGVLPRLVDRRCLLLHHGSTSGSDRRGLRTLRSRIEAAVAVDADSRDELRRLGFGAVSAAPADAFDGALDDVDADPAAVDALSTHPGPRFVVAGRVDPDRSIGLVIDAFADVLASELPSATLSICGPAPHWYAALLHRQVLTRGLMACELLQPGDDAQLAARLDAAAVVVALHPRSVGPYLRRAVRAGATVVAPLDGAALRLPKERLVVLPRRAGRGALARALAAAATLPPVESSWSSPDAPTSTTAALSALGIA